MGAARSSWRQQVKLLREFDRKIKDKKGDTKALFDKYREQLKDIQPRLIRAVVEPKNVGTILAGSAQARTTHVTPAQAPPTPLGEACRKLAEQSTGTKDLVVRYSPTSAPEEKRVERITSLSVPAIEGSPEKDALSRFEGDIKPLLGKGVEVVPRPRDEAGGPRRLPAGLPRPVRFACSRPRGGPLLRQAEPPDGRDQQHPPPQMIRVSGGAGDLAPEEVNTLVSQVLAVRRSS